MQKSGKLNEMWRSAIATLGVASSVLACARETSEPVAVRVPVLQVESYGPDRYSVSYSSVFGDEKARRACLRDANLFCEKNSMVMNPIEERPARRGISSGFVLIFSCVEPH